MQLPIWMTEDQAAAMMVKQIPRLSLPSHRQPDLFSPKDPPVPIAASERTKLLSLVSALLAETLAIIAEAETGDEDHA